MASREALLGKEAVRRLITGAAKALGVGTNDLVADALGEKSSTLGSWIARGRLPAHHRVVLEEIVATGQIPGPDIRAKQREWCKERLDELFQSLGPKGRAQLVADFTVWIEGRREELRRLDFGVLRRSSNEGRGKG